MSTSLADLMGRFHRSLLDDAAGIAAPDVKPNPRLAPEKQLAVYIDGYRIRLVGAIRSDYPALLALLGDKAFDALAHGYINANPPAHFNLDRYPHAFAAFVAHHANDDFAAELAMLEAAIAEVFMGEESAPLDVAALSQLSPEAFGEFILPPRAASRLLAFAYPVNAWLDRQRAGETAPRPAAAASYLYVYRHQNNVQRAPLGEPAYRLLEKLSEGLPPAAALARVSGEYPQHDAAIAAQLQTWFSEWMAKGFFRQSM